MYLGIVARLKGVDGNERERDTCGNKRVGICRNQEGGVAEMKGEVETCGNETK